MTYCYNCGQAETFVLLVEFALVVPGPDAPGCRAKPSGHEARLDSGGLSLAVQCSTCDSTDVGVGAADLLARYGSTTTS